jgi:hypothetical protein
MLVMIQARVMPLLKVLLQDMLEETKELTTDTIFKASG